MSLFKKITSGISKATDKVNDFFEPEEDGSSWGNGILFDWIHGDQERPDDTGGFGEGMYDMSQQLGQSRAGTNEAWGGSAGNRTYDSWSAGGGGLGGTAWGRGPGKDQGIGYGLGGGHWTGQSADGNRTSSGYGFGAGVSRRKPGSYDLGEGLGAIEYNAEQYRGVGGNAYQFNERNHTDMFGNDHGGLSGYGIDGNYTAEGYNNVTGSYDGALGTGSGSVENIVIGQRGGSLEGGRTDDGSYVGRASWTPGRTEVHGAEASLDSRLGHTDASLGSFGTGPRYQANGFYDPNTGNFSGGAQWAGGGWKMTDAAVSHEFTNGMSANARAGTIDTANDWALNAGWNNETNNVELDGRWNTGNTVEDAEANVDFGDGWGAHAGVGRYTDGNHFDGHATVGADGVHASGNGTWGGFDMTGANVSYGKEGVFHNQVTGDISTSSQVRGANLDIDGSGLHAGVDSVRTGGVRVNNVTGRNDIGGVTTDYSLGEFSNDTLVEGAGLDITGDGLHAEVGKVDFGGIRVNDWRSQTDFGDYGTLSTELGSFSNGNTIENAFLDANGDGLSFGADRIGALGMDINNAAVNYEGPGGAYANASMGSLHTGLGIDGLRGGINSDGLNLSADHADYNVMQLRDVNANYGVEGYYENSLHLGEGAYNSFSGDNINIQADMDGLGISGENLAYDYLRMNDFSADQSFGGGAVTTHLGLGSGSLGGGHADRLDFHTDGLTSDLSVENLNAHGLQMSDVNARIGAGDASVSAGAEQLNVLDLNVGNASSHTEYMGMRGNASVQDANLDLLNIQGGHAGIGWGDQEIAGISGDYRSHAGVESAQGNWDLFSGTASGSFENATYGAQMNNASVNFFGNEIALPDMGAQLNASGAGNVDLLAGQASGNVSLAGSSVNFAGHELTLGDWAQASGAVDASRGAVRANVGGENGVGVDASIADANLDLNLFGHTVDVDEGVRDAAGWVASTAGDAWNAVEDAGGWVSNKASGAVDAIASFLPSISLW